MGKDFYDRYEIARETFQQADDILERSLSKIVFEGPDDLLTQTKNSQTGIYVTSMALLRVLQKEFPELKSKVCAGLSLGEYTALTASEKISFESCLPLVQFRAEAMNEACERTKGMMAAIFGLSSEAIEAMVKELNLPNDLWTANFNCPGQTVISGTVKGVEAGMKEAISRGAKRALPLNVHGAFHSGLMKLAREKLAPRIEAVSFADSRVQLVMNVSGDFVSDVAKIRQFLIQQVTSSVRWEQSVRAMMSHVDLFLEIGCGKTLAGMNRQIGAQQTITINKVEDLEKLAQVKP